MAKTYKGKASLTLVQTTAGAVAYVYADQPVPDNVDRAEIKRLVDGGYLTELGSDDPVDSSSGGQGAGVVAGPDGTPAADQAAKDAAATAAAAAKK